jgi:hypothetical protein
MQKIFVGLGRLGEVFISKATQLPETVPRQRKLAMEAIGLHLRQYPQFYQEFVTYRKQLWIKAKTGTITLREIGYILRAGISTFFVCFLSRSDSFFGKSEKL